MSSLTSLTINKNSTRFTPSFKGRSVRRNATQPSQPQVQDDDQQISITDRPAMEESTTTLSDNNAIEKDNESPAVPHTTSEGKLDGITSQPIPKMVPSRTRPLPIAQRRSSLAGQERHDQFEKPKAGSSKPKRGNAISVPSAPQGVAISIPSERSEAPQDVSKDSHEKNGKGKGLSKENRRKVAFEELLTLDDIQHDPAKEEFLDLPVSHFLKERPEGIVSRMFKENERDRLSGKKETKRESSSKPQTIAKKQESEPSRRVDPNVLVETSHAPQVRLVNGEIVLDADSLQVEQGQGKPDIPFEAMEVVEENAMSRRINSNTWGKRVRGQRWTAAETEMFYDALAQFGTDFEMIAKTLPGRTRSQIRLKFNREERQNADKINEYLIHKRRRIDLKKYEEATGIQLDAVEDLPA